MRRTRQFLYMPTVAVMLLTARQAALAEELPFSSDAWKITAAEHRVEQHAGREALFLKDGLAVLEDVDFLNGILEFDILVVPERGFSGVRWRMQDGGNYENFYIRPHQSGNEDANQYQPVFHGVAGWQIYFGPEYSVAVDYPIGAWIPIRIEVHNDRAQVFIDSDTPSLIIDDLKHETRAGKLALNSGFAGAWFSRFRYQQTDDVTIAPRPKNENDRIFDSANLVREWTVSDAIAESLLANRLTLDASILQGLEWHKLPVETNGIANLARLQTNRGANTALVRLVLQADQSAVQRLNFGFSDRVRVYVNGTLLFSASDMWQSRDYRFLGTVGLYDTVYCPLVRGRNEVILAVSESFGGWAVIGELPAVAGVKRVPD